MFQFCFIRFVNSQSSQRFWICPIERTQRVECFSTSYPKKISNPYFYNKSYKRERNISYDRDSLISYWITTWAHCLIFNVWVTKTHRQLGKSNFVSIINVLKVWRSGLVWTPYSFSYFNNYSYWYFIKANIFFVRVQIKIWIK